MSRLARIVVPGLPHHVTQRGNRREAIFFEAGDQEVYHDRLDRPTAKRAPGRKPRAAQVEQLDLLC
jgi:putative transposase